MRDDLSELGRGAREITDPFPGFSATEVPGLPSDLWLRRTRAAMLERPALLDEVGGPLALWRLVT